MVFKKPKFSYKLDTIPFFNDLEVGLVYGNYWYENEQNRSRKILYKKLLPSGRILSDLLKNYVVGLVTIVIRRSTFESLHHPFNSEYHLIGDFDCVIRIAVDWNINCVQEPVAHYRWTGDNETNKNKGKQIQELEHWYNAMKQHPEWTQQQAEEYVKEQAQKKENIIKIENNNNIM